MISDEASPLPEQESLQVVIRTPVDVLGVTLGGISESESRICIEDPILLDDLEVPLDNGVGSVSNIVALPLGENRYRCLSEASLTSFRDSDRQVRRRMLGHGDIDPVSRVRLSDNDPFYRVFYNPKQGIVLEQDHTLCRPPLPPEDMILPVSSFMVTIEGSEGDLVLVSGTVEDRGGEWLLLERNDGHVSARYFTELDSNEEAAPENMIVAADVEGQGFMMMSEESRLARNDIIGSSVMYQVLVDHSGDFVLRAL
jgi:hypothetical protein